MQQEEKKRALRRAKIAVALRKARTSLEKVLASVEGDGTEECFPTIQQSLAVIGLLKSANLLMLEGHIDQETAKWKAMSPKRREEFAREILRVVQVAQNK